MSYSTIAHALVSYVEDHLESFSIKEMSESFGFSDMYLRELFFKNVNMPIMQYYRRRRMIASAFQKIFNMPPSRFCSERPLIGRKQLETGVFGLERLSSKEKRSDDIILDVLYMGSVIGFRKWWCNLFDFLL